MFHPTSRNDAGKNSKCHESSESERGLTHAMQPMHIYEVRPRKDHRGVNLISDVLPFGRLWYSDPNAVSNAISYAKFSSRSHDAVIAFTMKPAT
jgi:hypothetical protein